MGSKKVLYGYMAMNTSISHCYKYFYGHNFCSTAELMELRKICFMLAVVVSTIIADHQTPVTTAQPYVSNSVLLLVVVVMNMITKYFYPTRTTACVLRCQPSPHCTERGCKVFRRKNDSTIVDVRPSPSLSSKFLVAKTTLHFQTQKRLYNCRCPSVIITFFKIFSRKNDSTFVNVRP